MTTTYQFATLILAAGSSSRLGRAKQLLKIQEKTLLERTVELARSLEKGPVVVVLGARLEQIEPVTQSLGVEYVINPDWATGMGGSLACGVSYLGKHYPEIAGLLVLLVDQVKVTKAHLEPFFEELHPPQIQLVVSSYRQTLGVPALFDRSLLPKLQELHGQKGARRLIQNYKDVLAAIDLPEAAVDIDTAEDWEEVEK